MLAGQDSIDTLFHQPLSRPGNRGDTGLEGCRDLAVTPCLASVRGIGLQQNARLQQLPRRVFALLDQAIKPLSLLIAELHHVLLDRDFHRHESTPSFVTGTSIRTFTSESRTRGTSVQSGCFSQIGVSIRAPARGATSGRRAGRIRPSFRSALPRGERRRGDRDITPALAVRSALPRGERLPSLSQRGQC